MNRVGRTGFFDRLFATQPAVVLRVYSLLWLAVASGLVVKAIGGRSLIFGIESLGFLVVGLLLWWRSRTALVANLVLGLFLLAVGLFAVVTLGNWGGLLSGLFILGSCWTFREYLDEQSGGDLPPSHVPGLCLALLKRGWKPYRFPQSNVVVVLPRDFVACFDSSGVLIGTIDGNSHNFSATLHSGEEFEADPMAAYAFLDHLAQKSATTATEKGTYRYFKDPEPRTDVQLEYTFYLIAIPGALVVVSIASAPGDERPASLSRIESAIPDLIGELI